MAVIDRANWGRLQKVADAILASDTLELQILCGGSTVLERFRNPAAELESSGYPVVSRVFSEIEGSTPLTMARSGGLAQMDFAAEFARIQPDVLLLIGDRYQALAAATAAATMNIPILHMQGGEVSGSIDERYRHMITKAADYHWPATQQAAENIIRMGERPESVLGVGCPSSDIAREIITLDCDEHGNPVCPSCGTPTNRSYRHHRKLPCWSCGAEMGRLGDYLLAVFHPTTTQYGSERGEMGELLAALDELAMPCKAFWPNIDCGSEAIAKEIRRFGPRPWLETVKNLSPDDYARLLAGAACCVGNSSSFVRDSGFYGTPVVLVGDRQAGRECSENVIRVPAVASDIAGAVRAQLENGRYFASTIYGDGNVSARVVAALETLTPYTQKRLAYDGQQDRCNGRQYHGGHEAVRGGVEISAAAG